MLVCGMSWVLLTSLSLLWQLPQRPGISMVEVRDLGFDGSRMLCVPWQVLQPGALLSPRADAFPWRLAVYWVCSSGWHAPHSTLASFSGCGNSFLASSAWQETHSWSA